MATAQPAGVGTNNVVPSVHHSTTAPQASVERAKKLIFHCQQAHGSPMGFVSNFANVKELYQRIAECFGIPSSEILFCTLNTHKVDMEHLLGGQIGLEDFIFVHLKGRAKEIEISKGEEALGLTITDNGAGRAFIKRIKESSLASRIPYVNVGDHIERIDSENCIGKRHFEVACMLRDIPIGANFIIRLVEPLKSGFSEIGLSNRGKHKQPSSIRSGMETLRLRSSGPAFVQEADDATQIAITKINALLESYMGISDNDLVQQIWELSAKKENPSEFLCSVAESDIAMFGFSDDFLFDIWGAISDAKSGRVSSAAAAAAAAEGSSATGDRPLRIKPNHQTH